MSEIPPIQFTALNGIRPLELQAWVAWISAPVLALFSGLIERPHLESLLHVSAAAWGALAFTGIASSLIAHTGYFHLVQRYPVTSVVPVRLRVC